MKKYAIEINGLEKTYRSGVQALKGIDLQVEQGSFFALLGPNGAGKSTLINIIASLVTKTAGTVIVNGLEIDRAPSTVKQHLGLMPQEVNLGFFERVDHILLNQAGYYGIPKKVALQRMDKLLEQLSLTEKKTSVIRSLSGGMKRRVMVARAMMHDPDIVILDEPSAGVDIEIRRNMWDFFQHLNKEEGKTIILTTHYLEEAERLCDHVAIIDRGELITTRDMPSLLRELDHESFILYLEQDAPQTIQTDGCTIKMLDSTTLEVSTPKVYGIGRVINAFMQQGIVVNSIRNKTNRLESLFLELTGRHIKQESTLL